MKIDKIWFCRMLFCLLPMAVNAQFYNGSHWAISGSIGGIQMPVMYREGFSSSGYANAGNLLINISVERVFRNSPFSIRSGYVKEELTTTDGFISDFELQHIRVGTNVYPMHKLYHWPIQLYGGLDLGYSFSGIYTSQWCGYYKDKREVTDTRFIRPHWSLIPHVGAELYLFSSIALTMEYGYCIGLGGRIETRYSTGSVLHREWVGNANRHQFSFGLKVTFPFRFTREDGANLFMDIFMNLFNNHVYY